MITIKFSEENSKSSIDVIDLLNHFLYTNGLNSKFGFNEHLELKMNCANSNFTKAYGLLFLLFTEDNDFGYLSLGDSVKVKIRSGENFTNLYNYLKNHINVNIIYEN